MHQVLMLVGLLVLAACSNPGSPDKSAKLPASHTINKGGHLHKSGLADPLSNRVSCHGSDLKGGTAGVTSCSCQRKKW